jgi:tetratricopeptide (TPR) repeat protein
MGSRLPFVLASLSLLILAGLFFSAGEIRAANPVTVDSEEAEVIRRARELAKGKPGEAEALLNDFVKRKKTPAVLSELAILKARRGETDAGIRLFEEVLKQNPSFPGARKNLGRLLAIRNRFAEAAEALRKGIASDGPDGESCALLGQCYLAAGSPAPAETAFRWALLLKPSEPALHIGLTRALFEQGRYMACEKAALSALRLDPTRESAWKLLANARLAAGKSAEALDALEALRRLSPKVDGEVLFLLGDLYVDLGLTRQAVRLYEQALGRTEATEKRLRRIARAFLGCDDLPNAAKFAERLLQKQPQSAEAHYILARCAQGRGGRAGAQEHYEKALEIDPLFGEALLALGDMACEEKRFHEAMARYRSARAIKRFELPALTAEADLLLRDSRFGEALRVLGILREKDPGGSWEELIREVRLRLQEIRIEKGGN